MQTRAKIKRGSTDEETAERLDIAALCLKNLTSVVSMMNTNLGGKIDDLGDKIDSIKEDTGEITDTLSFLKFKGDTSRNVRIEREIRSAQQGCGRDKSQIKGWLMKTYLIRLAGVFNLFLFYFCLSHR